MIRARPTTKLDPARQRREEINGWLQLHGFGHEAVGRAQKRPGGGDSDEYLKCLRELLLALGGVFASFGLYLASRPDLLSLSDCVALASISHRSLPMPAESLRRMVAEAVADRADDRSQPLRLVQFDVEPFESRSLFQLHYGELENGDRVVIKVVRPTIGLEAEIEQLPLISQVVSPRLIDSNRFDDAAASFQVAIREQLDCLKTAESLETLAHDTRDNESLCVPKVYHELCTKDVLVTERLDGVRLDHYVASYRDESSGPMRERSFSNRKMVPDELARLLCDAWLRQAFQGTMLPVDIRPENILLRSPTEIAILDGSFVAFPLASRRNLLDYCIAVATDEPSKALACLLKEMDGTQASTSQTTLDRQFRQLVAFRDGGWEDDGRANCLSDTLFAQWRLAARHGWQPLRHLTHFYRGTFHITYLARQVAPHRDSLLEGVKDLRLTKLLNDIGTMMEPSYWGGQMDRLAALMILGPQHLDDALKSISNEEETSANPQDASHGPARTFNPLLTVLLAIAALFLFRDQLADLLTPLWAERLTAVLFIAIGGWTMRLLAFSGRA